MSEETGMRVLSLIAEILEVCLLILALAWWVMVDMQDATLD